MKLKLNDSGKKKFSSDYLYLDDVVLRNHKHLVIWKI